MSEQHLHIEIQRQRMLDARARLLRVLQDIAHGAAEQALERCPYRTRADVCTFRGLCRNQLTTAHAPRHCNGGWLDATPASAADIAAAFAALPSDAPRAAVAPATGEVKA